LVVIRLLDGRLAWYPPGAGDEPLWLDDEEARARLRGALAKREFRPCFAAPGEDVRLLRLSITAEEKKHIARSLPYMLEESVAQDIEDLHFASLALDKLELAVAICSREKMACWQQSLAELGSIRPWIPEPLLLPWQAGEWCLLLEQGRAVARVGQTAGFCVETDMLSAMLEAALREGEPDAVIVYGSNQQRDLALLPGQLQDKVQWRAGSFSSAMLLSDGGVHGLDLLQGDYSPRLPLGRWWRQWRVAAVVFAVAFGLQLAATYADYHKLKNENLALRGAVEQSYRRAYPRGAVVDAEKQLRRQLDALRGSAQSSGFISLVDEVGGVIAGKPGTSIASLNYNDKSGEMRMNIVSANFEEVEQVREAINEAGLEAVMESSSAQGDKVRARLRVGERS
jgi:type II secretion system protein L